MHVSLPYISISHSAEYFYRVVELLTKKCKWSIILWSQLKKIWPPKMNIFKKSVNLEHIKIGRRKVKQASTATFLPRPRNYRLSRKTGRGVTDWHARFSFLGRLGCQRSFLLHASLRSRFVRKRERDFVYERSNRLSRQIISTYRRWNGSHAGLWCQSDHKLFILDGRRVSKLVLSNQMCNFHCTFSVIF